MMCFLINLLITLYIIPLDHSAFPIFISYATRYHGYLCLDPLSSVVFNEIVFAFVTLSLVSSSSTSILPVPLSLPLFYVSSSLLVHDNFIILVHISLGSSFILVSSTSSHDSLSISMLSLSYSSTTTTNHDLVVSLLPYLPPNNLDLVMFAPSPSHLTNCHPMIIRAKVGIKK